MKNLFTLLSHLQGSMGNLQSSDMRHDCRLTVDSPSGLDAKWKQKGKMEQKGKTSTSCLLLASYLPPTCLLQLRYAAVVLFILTIGIGNVWGATVTFSYSSSGGWTTTGGAQSGTKDGVTIAATNGALNSSNSQIRVYSGATFTVSSSNTITKIEYTYSNASFALKSGSPGTYNSSTKIWTGSGTSISFTNNGQVRISSMTVTYTAAAIGPTITPSTTSLSGFEYANGSPVSKSFTVSGSSLKGNVTVAAPSNYQVSLDGSDWSTTGGNKTITASGTLSATTVYVRLAPGLSASSSYSGNITLSSTDATNKTVALSGSVPYTITWMANGNVHATTYVEVGNTLSLPDTDPNPSICGCTGSLFYGWYGAGASYSHATTAPTITEEGDAVTGNKTYYAVFVEPGDETSVSFTASNITATPSDGTRAWKHTASGARIYISAGQRYTSGTPNTWTVTGGTSNYLEVTGVYITKIEATLSGSNYKIGSVSKGTKNSAGTSVTSINANEVKLYATSDYQIRITTLNVFYKPFVNFTTNCCTALGTINGSITLSNEGCTPNQLKATWKMSATTGIASQVLHIYKASDDTEITASKITGISASTSNQTQTISGLDPCTAYYVKVENISTGTGTYCGDGFTGDKSSNVTTNSWGVTEHLTHATHTTGASTTCPGSNYVATYTVESGYVLPSNITLTIGGVSKTKDTHYTWSVSDDVGTLTILAANITNSAGAIDITITATAAAYQFWYGGKGTAWSATAFSDAGSNEWQITNFVMPEYEYNSSLPGDAADSKQMLWNVSGAGITSTNREFYAIPFAQTQDGCGTWSNYWTGSNKDSWIRGAAAGAKGTLRIYSDQSDNGKLAFIPNEYVLKFGTSELLFTETSTNVWETAITSLSTLNGGSWTGSTTYRVGVGDASHAYVEVYNKCAATAASAMGYKTNAGNYWATGLNNISTGRGKFRIWINNCTNGNWECHFVPYHRVVFHSNYPGGGGPADTYAGETSVEESNGSIALADAPSAPTGYHFIGWYDAAEGGNLITTARSISAGASANIELYAHWSNQTTITLSKNGGSENGSAVGTYGSNVVGSFVPVTRNSTTYRLLGYSKSGTPAEIVIDASGNFVANTTYTDASGNWKSTEAAVTLVAQWQAGHTITWMANGETYTTTFVDAGNTLVLPGSTPTSCDDGDTDTYLTFIGWYSTAAGTNSSPTASIGSCGTQATTSIVPDANQTYYAVWGNGTVDGTTTYEITTTLTKGKTYVFGAVKAEASTTLANNTAIGAVAFATTYSSCSWGEYVNVTPSSTGVISSSDVTAACIWTLENISSGNYSFKKSSNYVYLKDETGKQTAGINTSAQVYLTDETATCKDAFKLHPGSTSTNKLMLNTGSTYGYRVYGSGQAESGSMCPYIRFYEQKVSAAATGFISSCCASSAVVTVAPDEDELELDIDGEATTSVSVSQSGGGVGRYYPPTVTPAATGSTDWAGEYKTSAYSVNFTATAAGTYTIKAPFRETSYGCDKTGSATITVAANPILTPSSDNVAIDATCGMASSATDITVNSRYLASTSITASVVKSAGSGTFKISSDNSSFDTSNKTITGGTSTKATSHIYVRYDATEGQTGSATGTLTLTCGEKVVNIPLSATVTCSAHVVLSSESPIQITAANGIWVEAASVVNVEGSYLTTNSGSSNVSIRAYTNNAHFQIKTGGTAGEGAAKTSQGSALALVTNHSTASWNGTIGIVYKPAAHNTTETATLTVEVYRANGSTIYDTKTYTLYGRSLPENFVIAVTDGSGNWYAVPADMVAPWGGSCSSGLSTYKPYPIDVDDASHPTAVSGNTPSRAVYAAAARSSATTSPQTLRYKSVALSGSGNYFLYGSSTNVDSDGSNTNIQNATFADSEKQKWFLDVVDWTNKEYNMHLATTLNTNVLAFTTAGGARNVGQYAPNASTTKKAVYILPATSTCDNYNAPENITCYGIDATNYTIRFKPDRTKNYEVSLNGSSGWTSVTTRVINNCTDDSQPTLVEADIPLATYRGQTVYIRVKAAGSCAESTTFTVPNPTLTVNAGTWMSMTGVAGYAFSNSSNSITISGLASCANTVSVSSDNSAIGASIDQETGVVTLTMTSGNATVGTHNATLTFTAGGATTRTQDIRIEIYAYAPITISSDRVSDGYYCNTATDGLISIDGGSNKICGYFEASDSYVALGGGDWGTRIDNKLYDITTGETASLSRNAGSTDYVFKLNLAKSKVEVGHTYELRFNQEEFHNDDPAKMVYTQSGVPYQPTVFRFTVVDCSKPTALPACPIGTTSFTANWYNPSCSGTTTVNVYKKAETEILNTNFIEYSSYKAWSYAYNDTYYGVWVYGGSGTVHGDALSTTHTTGQYIGRSSKTCEWFSPKLSTLSGSITSETELVVEATVYHSNGNGNDQTLKVIVIDNPAYSNDDVPTSGNTVYFNGITATSWTSETISASGETKTFKISIKGATGNSRIGFFGTSKINTTYLKSVKISTCVKSDQSSVNEASCSNSSKNITGLTSGGEYYYTITNNGNTSVEQRVNLRSSAPSITYFPGKVNLQTDVNGTVSQEVTFTGKNFTQCDVETILSESSKTGSSFFTVTPGAYTYNASTGALSGSFTVTYEPTSTGEHTGTYSVGGATAIDLDGHACATGFGTMATGASSTTKNSATIGWSLSTTGSIMLAQGTRLNTELLSNGGFESGLAGWDETNSMAGAICTDVKQNGSNSRYCTNSNASLYVNGRSGFCGVYAEEMRFLPGTYHIEAYVRHAENSTTAGAFNLADNEFYIGICKDTVVKNNSYVKFTSIKANADYAFQFNNEADEWKKVELDFTLTETVNGRIFIARKTSTVAYFFLDDVSLTYTAAGTLTDKSMFSDVTSISSAMSTTLTGLKPQTTYSYYVVGDDGCESNIASFTTLASVDPITITATPNPVGIAGPIGKTVSTTINVTTENAYAQVVVGAGTCTDGRISVSPTSIPAEGGLVTVSFTPKTTGPDPDEMGDYGSCTLQLNTVGAVSPTNVTVNWAVSAGFDATTPVVEVVDIDNSGMNVEHNITTSGSATVSIIINRETTEEEREENVGDEIFFSKYYEANQNVKLVAIFNPTNEKISLAGTYLWLSRDAEQYWGHNEDNRLALSPYGKETGYIGPQEEIILYRYESNVSSDASTIACAAEKTDMSEWNRVNSNVLSFSGNDALLLVRDTTINNRIPPATSCNGDPLTWRYLAEYDISNKKVKSDKNFAMLDIIGARTAENYPSNESIARTWSWTNCKAAGNPTESGDATGWYGYGQDIKGQGYVYYNCDANDKAGYLLSTNRCLLIRLKSVKSGSTAVRLNEGDFKTLDWGNTLEWQGAHVPKGSTNQEEIDISCDNFTFVGGYDYAGYYNKWTPLTSEDCLDGIKQDDGSWRIEIADGTPHYYCKTLCIQVAEKTVVNGVEVENVHVSQEYKVPIVVDATTTTADASVFRNADDVIPVNTLTPSICNECDVVIRDNAKLTHVTSGQAQFRTMTIYPGSKFSNEDNHAFTLDRLHVQSLNNTVGYAIINNQNGGSITADTIIHTKRINDADWYSFTLPYDCDVATIRQLNGKVVGKYWDGTNYVDEDWTIQYYDGQARQAAGTSAATGADGLFWRYVSPNGTLKAGQAYIVGLFTTEWSNQHKTLYFPPKTYPGYTESGDDAKTTTVKNWPDNLSAEKRHHGWNFTGSPYISRFGETTEGQGLNNPTNLILGKIKDDGTYENETEVYVSIPNPGSKTYTQARANATALDPFKGYFVQATDPTNGNSNDLTLTYAKGNRTLPAGASARRAAATKQRVVADIMVTDQNEQSDIAGAIVDDQYTPDYEIGGDLTKWYAKDVKPQVYFLTGSNEKMAYIALPDADAENIPMEIYAPKNGNYTIQLNERSSRTAGAECVELLHHGETVANLLIESYTIEAKAGTVSGYSIRIRRIAQIATSTELINGEHISVITNDGHMSIINVPDDAEVYVYDIVGKLMQSGKAEGEPVINIDAPQQGVYNIVIHSAAGNATVKTLVR